MELIEKITQILKDNNLSVDVIEKEVISCKMLNPNPTNIYTKKSIKLKINDNKQTIILKVQKN